MVALGLGLLWPCPRPARAASEFNEYIVVAQMNLWYYGPGIYGGFESWDGSGARLTPLTPLLGETYFSSDPQVVRQQIDWAADHGVDAFSIEWTTPRGIPGSMEENLDDAFLAAENLWRIKWCIFHDFNLRLGQTPGLEDIDVTQGVDFNDPRVFQLFVEDFVHFARKYFGHPQYLTIKGRPVVYIWATWNFKGDLAGAVARAREVAAQEGYDLYLVGDEINEAWFDPAHAALFDAHTNFTFLIGGQDWTQWAHVGQAASAMEGVFQRWSQRIAGLTVAGRGNQPVVLQPGFAPQYDDRLFHDSIGGNSIWVLAENQDQVKAMAQAAHDHAQPVDQEGTKLVWINTWNNWAETTTLEPTAALGPKYPGGNYQFDMVDAVREVFGHQTFAP